MPCTLSAQALSQLATTAAAFYMLSLTQAARGDPEAPSLEQLLAFKAALREAREALGNEANTLMRLATTD